MRDHEKAESITVPEIVKYLILNYYLLSDKLIQRGKLVELRGGDRGINVKRSTKVCAPTNYAALGELQIGYQIEGIVQYQWSLELTAGAFIGIVRQRKTKEIEWGPSNGLPFRSFGIWSQCTKNGKSSTKFYGILLNEKNEVIGMPAIGKYEFADRETIDVCFDLKEEKVCWYFKGECIWKVGKEQGFTMGNYRLVVHINWNLSPQAEVRLNSFTFKQKS